MPKPMFQATAEGLPNRRRVLAGLAASALAASTTGAFARIVGASDVSTFQSEKFTGSGWYVFGSLENGSPKRCMFAFRDEHPFIALAEGKDLPVEVYISHRQFDRTCCAVIHDIPLGFAL